LQVFLLPLQTGRSRPGYETDLASPVLYFLFRFTVIWESIIVIIREKRAKVIEIIWERVEPRAA
jgi:hypothetical protein